MNKLSYLSTLALLAIVPNTYAKENVNRIIFNHTMFSDVVKGSYAHREFSKSITRRGCTTNLPKKVSEQDFSTLLNDCLSSKKDLTEIEQNLLNIFKSPLAAEPEILPENATSKFMAGAFTPLSTIDFELNTHLASNDYSGDSGAVQLSTSRLNSLAGKTIFFYDLTMNSKTSFTDADTLTVSLKSGNLSTEIFNDSLTSTGMSNGFGDHPNALAYGYTPSTSDVVELDKVYYEKSFGENYNYQLLLGTKIDHFDTYGFYPSLYPKKTVLGFFGSAGSPMTYEGYQGAGGAFKYKNNLFNFSAGYVALDNDQLFGDGEDVYTIQAGLGNQSSGIALAYSHNNMRTRSSMIPFSTDEAGDYSAFAAKNRVNYSLSSYFRPNQKDRFFPSTISAGIGYSNIFHDDTLDSDSLVLSWSTGLTWDNLFNKGNQSGFAFGQAPHLVRSKNSFEMVNGAHDDLFLTEAWYEYVVNDNVNIVPSLFFIHDLYGLEQNSHTNPGYFINNLGFVIRTTFKF